MHEAALRGGPYEAPVAPGCFLAGAGLIAVLALHTTPGIYPAASLVLAGLAGPLFSRMGAWQPKVRATELARRSVYGLLLAPLALGIPSVLAVRPAGMVLFWLAVYLLSARTLWAYAGDLLLRVQHQDALRTLPATRLPEYARNLAFSGPRKHAREDLLLAAAERLAAEGKPDAALSVLECIGETGKTASSPQGKGSGAVFRRRVRRLQSAIDFLGGDVEAGRKGIQELLAGPIDLEEGRQYRAWAAYLALAAGCPRSAAELADAAVGPQAIAGEAWFEHCRTLQAWALEQQGDDQAALQLARFVLANAGAASPYRGTLRALLSRVYLNLGEVEEAAKQSGEALQAGRSHEPGSDCFILGQRCRILGASGQRDEAVRVGETALAAARSPFAHALGHVDRGHACLLAGDPQSAAVEFRRALEVWPSLPDASEGLARAVAALGDRAGAEHLRAEAARSYPQHRVALTRL
jgi:tetratricopeptide (TPR) repeat protein